MIYTTYNPANGQILHVITLTTNNTSDANLQGRSFIEGRYTANEYYVENGVAMAKPKDPSTATAKHDFDYTTKSWVINNNKSIAAARKIRTILFEDIDRINPLWYASLTAEQQQELQAYRQALLDITEQAGWPTTIQWPAKPAWL